MFRIDGAVNPLLPAAISRENWPGLITDIQLWQPVVKNIVSVIDLDIDPEIVAGYPGSCAVFLIGEHAVIKIFPPLFASDFATERPADGLLHGRIETIPALFAAGIL